MCIYAHKMNQRDAIGKEHERKEVVKERGVFTVEIGGQSKQSIHFRLAYQKELGSHCIPSHLRLVASLGV